MVCPLWAGCWFSCCWCSESGHAGPPRGLFSGPDEGNSLTSSEAVGEKGVGTNLLGSLGTKRGVSPGFSIMRLVRDSLKTERMTKRFLSSLRKNCEPERADGIFVLMCGRRCPGASNKEPSSKQIFISLKSRGKCHKYIHYQAWNDCKRSTND